MTHTPNTNPQAQGETAEGISTKSIQNYLKWNCGAMDTAETFEKIIDFINTVEGKNEQWQPEELSGYIWTMQQWRNLMLLTAIESGEEINGKLSKYFRTVLNFD